MSDPRRTLIFGGVLLAAFGMLYGVHYAVFIEHQTLDAMGGSLAQAFSSAAERHMPEAQSAVDAYAATKYDYVRQVDVHSHWIGLAMLLIVLGVVFDDVAFSERAKAIVAWSLLVGSVMFPLGVILQTVTHGATWSSALAVTGSALVTVALGAVAWGFRRQTA